MNCKRCHHIDAAHESSDRGPSVLRVGRCLVPGCSCRQYLDPIDEIDEELT